MIDLSGKVALVTGGARRVGAALSEALARAGATVIVHHRQSDAEAADLLRRIEQAGGRALELRADLARRDEIERMMDTVTRDVGRLDLLVNSAATFHSAPFLSITMEQWAHVLAVNLDAPFRLTQLAAPLLRATRGSIINIVDLSAVQAWPSYAHHGVSKAGLAHLTRIAARALAPHVRVNAIAPGTVLPPEDYDGTGSDGTSDRRLVEREGSPDDVVRAMFHLIESEFVTGQILVVDGGRTLL